MRCQENVKNMEAAGTCLVLALAIFADTTPPHVHYDVVCRSLVNWMQKLDDVEPARTSEYMRIMCAHWRKAYGEANRTHLLLFFETFV